MTKLRIFAGFAAFSALASLPLTAVSAQSVWAPGGEINGQSIQVETDGITNMVYFDQSGMARIITPKGHTVLAKWTAANEQLCLTTESAQECWPYLKPFAAGKLVTLTSSCNATSRWLPTAINPETRGERG